MYLSCHSVEGVPVPRCCAGSHRQSAVRCGDKVRPQLLQDPAAAMGHYLQAAGGVLAAAHDAGDAAGGKGSDAAQPELHVCYAAEGGEPGTLQTRSEESRPPPVTTGRQC